MSCGAAVSVSRVRYSVRNCWSTETPKRYSLVAPSGMARVTTENADRNTTAIALASRCRPRRHSRPEAKSAARQPNWPTVVRAWSWFDELNAGHSTREIATSATTETTTATATGGQHLAEDHHA